MESLRRTVAKLHAAGILVGHALLRLEDLQDRRLRHARARPPLLGGHAADAGRGRRRRADRDPHRQRPEPVAGQPRLQAEALGGRRQQAPGGDPRRRDHPLREHRARRASGTPSWAASAGPGAPRRPPTRRGPQARHYGVDGCINGYIIDQETHAAGRDHRAPGRRSSTPAASTWSTSTAARTSTARRFNYYVSKFQAVADEQVHASGRSSTWARS